MLKGEWGGELSTISCELKEGISELIGRFVQVFITLELDDKKKIVEMHQGKLRLVDDTGIFIKTNENKTIALPFKEIGCQKVASPKTKSRNRWISFIISHSAIIQPQNDLV